MTGCSSLPAGTEARALRVVPLGGLSRHDVALAGGKGANLAELVGAGFRVPAGFVVTTAAFDAAFAAWADPEQRRAGAASVEVPPDVRRAITAAYEDLGAGAVAVRSSATAEDLPGSAFAGQQDTYLNVLRGDEVVDAVRRCWASLWTDRAVEYRRVRGVESATVRMAVVVQRMVAADTAGVLFTADPVSGDRHRLVVDASPGLGEAVVSGRVTPDHVVLDPRGRVRERRAGRREVVLEMAAGGGVAVRDPAAGPVPPPTDAELAELARLGADVERLLGRPQDIEWARAGGVLYVLQARPMTALPPPPVHLGPLGRQVGSVLLEYLPVRPYPLDMSTWVAHGPAAMMADMAASFGVRVFDGFLREEDGVVTALVPLGPRPTPAALRAPWRIAVLARRHDPARWAEDPRFLHYLDEVRALAGRPVETADWAELVGRPRLLLATVAAITALRIDYLPRTGLSLVRLLLALTVLGRRRAVRDVLRGLATRTEAANGALEDLAALARADADVHRALDARDLDMLRERSPAAADAVRDFLADYGHRETVSPLLVTPPTWADDPATVLDLVAVLAAGPPRPAGPHGARGTAHRPSDAVADHRVLRSSAWARRTLDRWADAGRAGVAFREDTHFEFTRPLPPLRRSLLEIGRRLAAAGVLTEPEDVFHLRLEEIETLDDPAAPGVDPGPFARLTRTARARAARRTELAGVRLIDPVAVFGDPDRGDALVVGTPAGGGTASGPVRVVRGTADFALLADGDVLVCPYTNPSWTPLFARATAVVVDSGGSASHAAIVAREYGIPAIMGTVRGTEVLTDGDHVTVQGDRGRVLAAGAPSAT